MAGSRLARVRKFRPFSGNSAICVLATRPCMAWLSVLTAMPQPPSTFYYFGSGAEGQGHVKRQGIASGDRRLAHLSPEAVRFNFYFVFADWQRRSTV